MEGGIRIPFLTNATTPLDGSELIIVEQGGVTKKTTVDAGQQIALDAANAAQTTANSASSAASAAQTTANTAVANAATAQSTANTAVSNAATAQSTANTAVANAATAQSTANTGVTNAASAQSAANGASNAASAAQATANTALSRIASKIYVALLTQTGTNAPVVTILQSTFSGALTWTYTGVGIYTVTSASNEFTSGRTAATCSITNYFAQNIFELNVLPTSMELQTLSTSAAGVNGMLKNSVVEIRVY
jgi:hypothetical protein